MAAVQQLSGTIVVIIIAVGVQACIMLFIFAKRQIQRFALRNRRGPHMSIGHGGPKTLRREADKLLDYVQYIKHEPILDPLSHDSQDFRRLLLISFQSFEYELGNYSQYYIRPPCGNVRAHMISCLHGPLLGCDTKLIHQVCDDYNSARHHYEAIDNNKYQIFLERLKSLRNALKANKLVKPHPSPLPPPPQSFSDSPRKRRGRGYLSSTNVSVGQVSGANSKRSDIAHRRQGAQNKLIAQGSGVSYTNDIQTNIHDNTLHTQPESLSLSDKTSGKAVDKTDNEIENIKKSSEESTNLPSAQVGSIVSVETKYIDNNGGSSASSAAV